MSDVAGRAPLLYDADCGFCRWTVAKVLACDRGGRLEAIAIQDPRGASLLRGMPIERQLASWHLVGPGGTTHSAGDVFGPLLQMLGRGFSARVAAAFPAMVRVGYRAVAGRRGWFGRRLTRRALSSADERIKRSGQP